VWQVRQLLNENVKDPRNLALPMIPTDETMSCSLLQLAADAGSIEVALLLIHSYGLHPDTVEGKLQDSAATLAAKKKHWDLVVLLCARGGTLSPQAKELLQEESLQRDNQMALDQVKAIVRHSEKPAVRLQIARHIHALSLVVPTESDNKGISASAQSLAGALVGNAQSGHPEWWIVSPTEHDDQKTLLQLVKSTVAILKDQKRLDCVEILDFRGAYIADVNPILEALRACTSIRIVRLSFAHMTQLPLQLVHFPALSSVSVAYNPNLSPEFAQNLATAEQLKMTPFESWMCIRGFLTVQTTDFEYPPPVLVPSTSTQLTMAMNDTKVQMGELTQIMSMKERVDIAAEYIVDLVAKYSYDGKYHDNLIKKKRKPDIIKAFATPLYGMLQRPYSPATTTLAISVNDHSFQVLSSLARYIASCVEKGTLSRRILLLASRSSNLTSVFRRDYDSKDRTNAVAHFVKERFTEYFYCATLNRQAESPMIIRPMNGNKDVPASQYVFANAFLKEVQQEVYLAQGIQQQLVDRRKSKGEKVADTIADLMRDVPDFRLAVPFIPGANIDFPVTGAIRAGSMIYSLFVGHRKESHINRVCKAFAGMSDLKQVDLVRGAAFRLAKRLAWFLRYTDDPAQFPQQLGVLCAHRLMYNLVEERVSRQDQRHQRTILQRVTNRFSSWLDSTAQHSGLSLDMDPNDLFFACAALGVPVKAVDDEKKRYSKSWTFVRTDGKSVTPSNFQDVFVDSLAIVDGKHIYGNTKSDKNSPDSGFIYIDSKEQQDRLPRFDKDVTDKYMALVPELELVHELESDANNQ
jgi:hypothetical protein